MILLAIDWAVVGVKLGQLLLSLSILVILHEFGHYITAKWFGCRVERFFLFFDPWFALFKKKVGDTIYGIGWLPLGGYVKIAGMIDESMDREQMKLPAEKWEFRSKPAWQRLIIMLGGIIMNVITAILIYSFVSMVWGEKKVPISSVKYGIAIQDSLMYDIGLKNGDEVVSVNAKPITDFKEVQLRLVLGDSFIVKRGGQLIQKSIPVNLIGQLAEKKRIQLLSPRVEPYLAYFADTMGAAKAGLKAGDKIVAVNGTAIKFYDELKPLVSSHASDSIKIAYLRQGAVDTANVWVAADGKIGVLPYQTLEELDSMGVLKLEVVKYSLAGALPAGVRLAKDKLMDYIDQFKKIVNPDTGGYKAIGGFKAMGSLFAPVWDWESFWLLTAFLSIMLAFMNLLPIPALDGGHVLFTLIEMITGRKPNQKFLEYAQVVGMVLLLGLMLYANGNDWLGWGRGR